MADTMQGLKRTHYCGEVTEAAIGSEVVVSGWVQRARNLGNLIFIDLRDRSGVVQLAFGDKTDRAIFEKAAGVRGEYVLMAKGVLRRRESVNKEFKTGEVEIEVTDLRVLAKSETPPFEIVDNTNVKEELRLKYRYLDLRRSPMQQALTALSRSPVTTSTRTVLWRSKPRCSSSPPPKAPVTIWCPPVYTPASSMLCPSRPSSTSSC